MDKQQVKKQPQKAEEFECCCPKQKINGYKVVNAGCKVHGVKASYPPLPNKKW